MLLRIVLAAALTLGSGLAFASDGGVPALRVTAPNGNSSTLIGTLHVPYRGLVQPAPEVLDGRKRLVVESSRVTGPQPEELSPSELLHPDVIKSIQAGRGITRAPWATHLNEEQINRLLQAARCSEPSLTKEQMTYVLALRTAEMAAGRAYLRCGPGWGKSRDEILNQAANERGIPIDVLESQVDVDRRRKAVPPRMYETQLADAFEPDVEARFRSVVDALNRGDYDTVLSASQGTPRFAEDAATFKRLMLTERNAEWITPLRRYLDEGDAVVVVGAAHLPGTDGVVALLRGHGYRVEPILLPAQ